MKKIICCFFTLVFCVSFFSACSPKPPQHYVAFYLESQERAGTFDLQRTFMLPIIDKEVRVARDPIFNIDAFSDCSVVEKFDPILNQHTAGLFFRIKDEYTIRLRQIAAGGEGRRFILVADGRPLGFCLINRNLTRNDLFFYVMTSATGMEARKQLEDLSFDLNGFILEYREYKEQR